MTTKKIKKSLSLMLFALVFSFPAHATEVDVSGGLESAQIVEVLEITETLEDVDISETLEVMETVEAAEDVEDVDISDIEIPVASASDALPSGGSSGGGSSSGGSSTVPSSGGSSGGGSSSGSVNFLTVDDLESLETGTDLTGVQQSLDDCVKLLLVCLVFQGIEIGAQCCLIFSQFWRWSR